MLHQAELTARRYSGHGALWQHPYANPQPRAASALASVWFTAYPASHHHRGRVTRCCTAWATPSSGASSGEIGITADAHGAHEARRRHSRARVHADRRRQLRSHQHRDRSRLRHRGRIQGDGPARGRSTAPSSSATSFPATAARGPTSVSPSAATATTRASTTWWRSSRKTGRCCRRCRPGKDSVNLKPDGRRPAQGARLHRRAAPAHHLLREGRQGDRLVRHRRRRRRDGKTAAGSTCTTSRRGSPPSTGSIPPSPRSGSSPGDAMHSLGTLGETHAAPRRQRLPRHRGRARRTARAWSEGHPLSVTSNQLIAGLVRKLGGFTFQELNLTLEDIKAMSQGGAGSLLRLRHAPRLPPRPRHRRRRVPASHARRCRRPTRSIRPASSTRCRTTTS